MLDQQIKDLIRDVPDFPEPGILFKDITPLLQNPAACNLIQNELVTRVGRQHFDASSHQNIDANVQEKYQQIDAIIGIESRGFLFGMLLAQALQVPFIPIRKAGKLPSKVIKQSYDLEYGSSVIEMHADALKPNQRVWIHDDILATGGTAVAAAKLVQQTGAQIAGFVFIIELGFLKGRALISPFSKNIVTLAGY